MLKDLSSLSRGEVIDNSLSLSLSLSLYSLYALMHSYALGSFIDFTVLVQEFTTTVSVQRNESTEYKFRFVLFLLNY